MRDRKNWILVAESTRIPQMADVKPKNAEIGQAKYYETYTWYAYKGKGINTKLIGTLKCDAYYTDKGSGIYTSDSIQYYPLAVGRFEAFQGGHVRIKYLENNLRLVTVTAAMSRSDREKHGHAYAPLRNLPTKFAKDRE